MDSGDCLGADFSLRDLESSEGPCVPVLQLRIRAAECVGDSTLKAKLEEKIGFLRVFE
jgi:hypothetical protein